MTTLPPRHITFCTSNLPGTLQLNKTARCNRRCFLQIGAGNQVRTGDLYLGKVPLYQLSYSRRSYLLSNYALPSTSRSAYSNGCTLRVKKTLATSINKVFKPLFLVSF